MKRSLVIWILSFIIACIYGLMSISSRQVLSTDLLSILSDSSENSATKKAQKYFDESQSRQLLIAYKTDPLNASTQAFQDFAKEFCSSSIFAKCDYLAEDKLSPKSFFEFYDKYRAYLIADEEQKQIHNSSEDYVNSRYQYLMSPIGASELSYLDHDPFGILSNFFRSLNIDSSVRVSNSLYSLRKDGEQYYFVFAELIPSWQDLEQSLSLYIDSFRNQLNSNEAIYSLGASLYFEAGSEKSIAEANRLAIFSIVMVSVLLFISFGSFLPMLASVFSILYSILLAFSFSIFVFGQIHAFVFLMGISLMGVICDYCIHYFSHRMKEPEQSAGHVFLSIRTALLLSLASSCLGYLSFGFSSIDLLRQLAFFAVIGLVAAYFSVYAFLASFPAPKPSKSSKLRDLLLEVGAYKDQTLAQLNHSKSLKSGLFFIGLTLVSFVSFDFDVRKLQEKDPELLAQEQKIKELTGFKASGDYFLISAKTEEDLLQAEEKLRNGLGKGVSYNSISKWVPSLEQQKSSLKAFQNLKPLTKPLFEKIGLQKDLGEIYSLPKTKPLSMRDWLSSSVSWRVRDLFLGEWEGRFYSVLPIYSASSSVSLPNFEGIEFVSKSSDYSLVFSQLGQKTLIAIVLISVLLIIFTSLRENFFSALKYYYAAIVGVLFSIGLCNLFTGYIDFFHILGAFLVFFLAVDYSFFCHYTNEGDLRFLRMGLFLSALTSLCSFGILAFSSTNAVGHFGMALSIGILVSYLLSFVNPRRVS